MLLPTQENKGRGAGSSCIPALALVKVVCTHLPDTLRSVRQRACPLEALQKEVWQEESRAVVFPKKCLLSQMVFFDFLFID